MSRLRQLRLRSLVPTDRAIDVGQPTGGPEILLVRYGPSALQQAETGWIDADGLRRWMIAYDAASIALQHPPPTELLAIVAAARRIVTSDLPRAVASAEVLAPGRTIESLPLLREAPLETPALPLPALRGMRLPFSGWKAVFAVRWINAWLRGGPPPGVDAATLARADEAARWLDEAARREPGRVVVVTHATFRFLVARSLVKRGWRCPDRRSYREWSAWGYGAGLGNRD